MIEVKTLKPGDEVLIRATVDIKAGPSVWLVADGAVLGRMIKIPGDVLVEVTGKSPIYRKESSD